MNKDFLRGLKTGIPICLGYLSVSIGFGIMAVRAGMSPLTAVIISLTNLTSAGQAAGVGVIAASGTYIEMILTQLLINARYCLMALSLNQNTSGFTRLKRMAASYGITDEIFGAASAQTQPITPSFMFGIILLPTIGWTAGTFIGAVLGDVLPARITAALGIMLYGMFMAVIIPPVRESWKNLAVILIAAAVSCIIYYFIPAITSGFSIIISAVIAAAVLAVIAPIDDEEEQEAA